MRLRKLQPANVPACYVRRCAVAHLQNPGFEPWLFAARLLRSEATGPTGLAMHALIRAGWDGDFTLALLASMRAASDEVVNDWREQERKKAANQSAAKRGRR